MCGIAGFCRAPGDDLATARLARELLLCIESRGGDATGYAYRVGHDADKIFGAKADLTASKFVDTNDFQVVPEATVFIAHTRFATQGSYLKNHNNHPINVDKIVGVHNGVVYNDNELFKVMGIEHRRIGEVDSEAIFAALAYGNELMDDNSVRLAHTIPAILEEIEASMAIAWLDVRDTPEILHLAKGAGSPLWLGETFGGSLIFASTRAALVDACKRAEVNLVNTSEVKLGTYLIVTDGKIVFDTTFEPAVTFSTTPSNSYWAPTPDQGDRYGYQDWWKENAKAVVAATSPKDAAVTVVGTAPAETRCYRCETLENALGWQGELSMTLRTELAAIFNIETLPVVDGPSYDNAYDEREEAIQRFYEGLHGDRVGTLLELGSRYRPGDWVQTKIAGIETDAQIFHLPSEFPGGAYMLRALIRNDDFKTGYEPILISRLHDEFEPVTYAASVDTVDIEI